jgi:autotransporter-associated beta strand protein
LVATLSLASAASAQTTLFWNTNGNSASWTSSNWSSSGSPPFSTAWTTGATAHFTSRSNVSFATASIGDVIVDPGVAVTVSAGGTLSTAGAVRTIDVGAGGSLTWTNQTVSNNSTTGFVKTGAGTWSLGAQSNAYTGGFTLAQGTVVVTGARSLGTGAVTLTGGTLQSSGSITFGASSLVLGET